MTKKISKVYAFVFVAIAALALFAIAFSLASFNEAITVPTRDIIFSQKLSRGDELVVAFVPRKPTPLVFDLYDGPPGELWFSIVRDGAVELEGLLDGDTYSRPSSDFRVVNDITENGFVLEDIRSGKTWVITRVGVKASAE